MAVRKFKCASCGAEFEEPYGTGRPVCPKCGSNDVYRIDEDAGRNVNVDGRGTGLGRGLGRGMGRGLGMGQGLGRGTGLGRRRR